MGLDVKNIPDSLSGEWQKAFPPTPRKMFRAPLVRSSDSSTPRSSDFSRNKTHANVLPDRGGWTPPAVTKLAISR